MKLKNIDLWEKVLEDMPESYKEWLNGEREFLRASITKDSKVLEVGCGEGRSLKDIFDITKDLTGIDNAQEAIDDAKNNLPEIKFLKADGKDLPFEDKSFDFVICMTTFANFGSDKYKILEEMKRVLKNDGKIILSVFSEDAFEERMKLYKKVKVSIKEIKGTTVIFEEGFGGENISEQFSKEELEEIFNKVELNLIEIKKIGMGYVCKLSK